MKKKKRKQLRKIILINFQIQVFGQLLRFTVLFFLFFFSFYIIKIKNKINTEYFKKQII